MLRAGDEIAGRYRVVGPLAAGGMASVHLVDDLPARRRRVLKELRLAGPELLAAFRDEFALLATLSHPGLTRVLDFGSCFVRGALVHFYTAELVEGVTLSEAARARGEVPIGAALDALEALEALHARGIRHGDVTPENLLVRADDRGVLIDLGCARPFGVMNGVLSGTPEYMAPELCAAGRVDGRADLFAFGRTLERAHALARCRPSAQVEKWIARLVAPVQSERPSSAAEVLEGLGRPSRRGLSALRQSPRLLGRDAQLERFTAFLAAFRAEAPGPRVLAVRGPSGSGSSRLLRELVSRAELELPVLRASADDTEPVSFLLATASGLAGPLIGARGALAIREVLEQRPTPLLLAVHDADRLEPAEAELLAAFARLLGPKSRTALLVSGVDPLPGVTAELIEPAPLSRDHLREWLGGGVSERALGELLAATGGLPAAIEAELGRRKLRAAGRGAGDGRELEALVSSQDSKSREALALLVACGGNLDPSEFGFGAERFAGVGPLVRGEGSRIRLSSRRDLARLAAALPPALVKAQHARLADALLEDDVLERPPGSREAELVFHLLHAGENARALETLTRLEPVWRSAPWSFARKLRELEKLRLDAETSLVAAEIALLSADAELALGFVARGLAVRPRAELSEKLRLAAAEALLRAGKPARAERALTRWLSSSKDGHRRALAFERLARARAQRGDHAGAERAARDGLALEPPPDLARALNEALGLAASYLGRTAEAEALFERILSTAGERVTPRDHVRLLGAHAIVAFRAGRWLVAAERHRRAFELAERHGLDDQLCVAAANLGTAEQQAGDLGRALSTYERGLSLSLALGRTSTELLLRYNLASLRAELGAFSQARAELDTLSAKADPARLLQLGPAIAILRAELAIVSGDNAAARRELERVEPLLEQRKLERELLELELLRIELELLDARFEGARARAAAAAERARALAADDLVLRAELLLSRAELPVDVRGAVHRLEQAASRAQASGQDLLEAKLSTELFRIALERGDADAPLRAERARRHWDRLAANLREADREAFWQDPRRSLLSRQTQVVRPAPAVGEAAVLRRLLSLSRRVNSSLSLERVLDYAVDAAVELSGAERGFVLLSEPGAEPRVAAARAGDEPSLLPSRSIVERVLESQDAVMTTDAVADERFTSQGSIHALRLKSVLSVPISTPEQALGAIYVDSRVKRGRFGETEREVLTALADQVAVALANARLHAALEARSRELEAEKRAVERLSRAKDRELGALKKELGFRARELELRYDYSQIAGRGSAMRELLSQLDRVMDTGVNLLLLGESGTGKELVARAVHANGARASGPFVGVNCAAMPETLLESELFGHVRGAFTGAERDRKGLLQSADGGTLFLDEIGEMSLSTQAKLLRVLQERELYPLGSSRAEAFDARVICATHRDLLEEVAAGRFREDLYYRVAVVSVRVPPLRERLEDLPELARTLLARIARASGRSAPELDRGALKALAQYAFPGNVRELENILTRALVMAGGSRISASDLELGTRKAPVRTSRTRREFEREERERILQALRETRWNVSTVSRKLGIPRNTLYRKLERYGLEREPVAAG